MDLVSCQVLVHGEFVYLLFTFFGVLIYCWGLHFLIFPPLACSVRPVGITDDPSFGLGLTDKQLKTIYPRTVDEDGWPLSSRPCSELHPLYRSPRFQRIEYTPITSSQVLQSSRSRMSAGTSNIGSRKSSQSSCICSLFGGLLCVLVLLLLLGSLLITTQNKVRPG